jgi:hypothetical protein
VPIARLVRIHRTQFGVVFVAAVSAGGAEEESVQLYFAIERSGGVSTSAWFFDFEMASGVRVVLCRA